MKKVLSIILVLLALNSSSQNLPHWLTEDEKQLLPSYLQNYNNMLRGTNPPAWTPRAMAEWEEIQGLLITWTDYPEILRQIVDYAQEECAVYIVSHSSETDSNEIKNDLSSNGIPLTNVRFLNEDFNSIWCRDYGQWNIYRNDAEEHSLVDWIYNRPRPKDDVIPGALANMLGLPIYEITQAPYDLVHTGGNFMVDGHGTGFSSRLILEENGFNNDYSVTVKSEEDIDTIMKKYLGLDRYVLMETLPYDEIHHIDMHMKLLDEETLLVGEFPAGVSDGPQIEENIQYIQDNYLNCYGRPYNIVRIPMVPSTSGSYPPTGSYRTYANSVFINKTLLVPTYREEYDTTALRIYRENLPGYNVYGIDCDNSSANIIASLGALHCITKEIGQSDPIWIDHASLLNTTDEINPYLVEAKIKTPSGVSEASLFWTIDTNTTFTSLTMTAAANDTFYGYIPAQPAGSEIFYYINAESNSGRNVSKPLTAPEGWMNFLVEGSTVAPEIKVHVAFYEPYPNPSSQQVNLGFVMPHAMNCELYVADILGRKVLPICSQTLQAGPHKFTLNAHELAPGIYTVKLIAGSESLEQKMVITD